MQLPNNRVGFVLIFVVLSVASTVFFSKVGIKGDLTDLRNVDLVVARNTDTIQKSGDADLDGLSDWQEELWKSDPTNPDTDGDGTNDGEEIAADRDPTIAGPNDILINPSDYFQSEVDFANFASGTVSDKLSVDLFSRYLNLKQKGAITQEQQVQLVDEVAQKVAQEATLEDKYALSDFVVIASSKESVRVYGSEFARLSMMYLNRMESYKTLSEVQYLAKMAATYKEFAAAMSTISVPDVAKDVHIQIVNRLYNAGVMFEVISKSDEDPVSAMVVVGQYQAQQQGEAALYTSLAQYFKNNGIIFDDTATARFWNYFE
jgi:hypothetical protein